MNLNLIQDDVKTKLTEHLFKRHNFGLYSVVRIVI